MSFFEVLVQVRPKLEEELLMRTCMFRTPIKVFLNMGSGYESGSIKGEGEKATIQYGKNSALSVLVVPTCAPDRGTYLVF